MKSFLRKIPFVAVFAIVGGLIWYGFLPTPVKVDIASVERSTFDITINDDGETRIREKYTVTSPVAGKLLRVDLEAGDSVYEGETVIARIEPAAPALLDARTIAQSEARVQSARASIQLAQTRVEQAERSQKLAMKDFKRAESLLARKAVARSEFDKQQHQLEIAQADVRSAEFARQVAKFEAELAKAAMIRTKDVVDASDSENDVTSTEQLADGESLDLTDTGKAMAIVSPVEGRVLQVFQEDAGVIHESTRILQIGDPRDLEMRIDILSSEAVRVDVGDRVIVNNWGGDEPLEGTVRLVEPAAFIKTSSLGVDEHRVNVIADFHGLLGCDCRLGDGFRIEANIVVDTAADVITVPSGALFRSKGGWSAYCVEGDVVRRKNVKVGRTNGLQTEILSGLKVDERVVMFPTDRVRDGVQVVANESIF